MKKRLLQLLFLLVLTGAYGQVGIGTSMPDNSSQLDVVAENRGILIPRLKLTSTTDILTISKGNVNSLLVFNTATTADVKPGYYYWFEDRWNRISIASDLGSSQSNVIFNPTINDFSYINNAGNIQVINFENLVKTNETVTELVNNNNGTYTYNNEAGTPVIIDANTTKVSVVDGVYTFIDAAGNTITSIDTNASASAFDNTASGLTASNVQSAIDELATTIVTNKGDLTVAGGLEFTGGTNGIAKLLADAGIQVAIGGIGSTQLANNAITSDKILDGTIATADLAAGAVSADKLGADGALAGKVATVNADGTVSYQDISATNLVDTKGVTTDGIIKVNGTNALAKSVLLDAELSIAAGGIGSTQLANSAVTTDKIADGAVTNAKVGADAITSDKILDGTITTADLANKAVTADKLGSGAATSGQIATANGDGTVTYKDITITDANITSTKGVTTDGIIKVNGTNALAKSVLLDAELSIADGGITSTQLATNAVTTDKIADGAVTNAKVGADAINSDKILDGTITTVDLANKAVTSDKLGSGTATSGQIATANGDGTVTYKDIAITDANITSTKGVTTDGIIKVNGTNALAKSVLLDAALSIADGGITTDKIADGAVTNAKVGADAITSNKILDGTIATVDLANKAVTADKLGSGTATSGQIATANGDGT
ncbi:beta strand repeat-containing protein, partial [Flavobacterium branchiarum]